MPNLETETNTNTIVESINLNVQENTENSLMKLKELEMNIIKKLYNHFFQTNKLNKEELNTNKIEKLLKTIVELLTIKKELNILEKELLSIKLTVALKDKLILNLTKKLNLSIEKLNKIELIDKKKKTSRIIGENSNTTLQSDQTDDVELWNLLKSDTKKFALFMKNNPLKYLKLKNDYLNNPSKYYINKNKR